MLTEVTAPLWAIFVLLSGWLFYRWQCDQADRARQKFYTQLGLGLFVASGTVSFWQYLKSEVKRFQNRLEYVEEHYKPICQNFLAPELIKTKNLIPVRKLKLNKKRVVSDSESDVDKNPKNTDKFDQKIKKLYRLVEEINEKLDDQIYLSESSYSEEFEVDPDEIDEESFSEKDSVVSRSSHETELKKKRALPQVPKTIEIKNEEKPADE